MNVKGGFHHGCKDVYFLRITGINAAMPTEIQRMDQTLTERMNQGQGFYNRLSSLPRLTAMEDAAFYGDCYENWRNSGKQSVSIKAVMPNQQLCQILSRACEEILGLLEKGKQGMNSSIEKNFMVKVFFWLDQTAFSALQNWKPENSMKVACMNIARQQEYLFCYLLTLLGFDVLLLQTEQDISPELERLELSRKCVAAGFEQYEAANSRQYAVPEYRPEMYAGDRNSEEDIFHMSEGMASAVGIQSQTAASRAAVNVKIPERDRRTREMLDSRRHREVPGQQNLSSAGETVIRQNPSNARETVIQPKPWSGSKTSAIQPIPQRGRRELSYEELAQLASSVVQIMIHDGRGDVIGGGSGIMIGREGYILTNNHVACRGRLYSVRIEEDQRVYQTDEMIKYNSVLDLAVIRIERKLSPLPIYKGEKKLVRGQRVVAIGSPLGLFNSVSDGIISGFREIEGVDMIQFTAPISNGSSGGAVLNMYGEVIGISTAGFDAGQNINLAVGYEYIGNFVRGFVN